MAPRALRFVLPLAAAALFGPAAFLPPPPAPPAPGMVRVASATIAVPVQGVWRVPAGITAVTFTLTGGSGGSAYGGVGGGPGGTAQATFTVTPGEPFQITPGGDGAYGSQFSPGPNAGGGNGGGAAGDHLAGGGGGATDLRRGACAASASCGLADRVLVAGGGGGAFESTLGSCGWWFGGPGGAGGGLAGGAGVPARTTSLCGSQVGTGGGGGTQTAGGASCMTAAAGTLGQGGVGNSGGGGGYYGGGGGCAGGGGGGSGYGPPGTVFGVPSTGWAAVASWTPLTTMLSLASSVNPAVTGQPVAFTARVAAPGSGLTPTGAVEFSNPACSQQPLDASGTATCTVSNLPPGHHSITATYPGGDSFAPASAGIDQVIEPASTATSVSASQSPALVGSAVTYTAAVAPRAPGGGVPAGSVTFQDGGAAVGTAQLDGAGHATLTTTYAQPGTHSISAVYAGTDAYLASTSPPITVLARVPATVTLAFSPAQPLPGQPLRITITVAPSIAFDGKPTGTATISDNGAVLGTATVDPGTAVFTIAHVAAGEHRFAASFSGDGTFAASSSGVAVIAVGTPLATTGAGLPLGPALALVALGLTVLAAGRVRRA